MNRRLKSAIIGILSGITKLNSTASVIPFSVASKNPYMLIAKIVLGILSVIADWLLLSLVAVKQTSATLLSYKPNWWQTLSTEEQERRDIALKNRIKRESNKIKIDWMQKYGTPEAEDKILKGLRK